MEGGTCFLSAAPSENTALLVIELASSALGYYYDAQAQRYNGDACEEASERDYIAQECHNNVCAARYISMR